jgi:hypothetical protein
VTQGEGPEFKPQYSKKKKIKKKTFKIKKALSNINMSGDTHGTLEDETVGL